MTQDRCAPGLLSDLERQHLRRWLGSSRDLVLRCGGTTNKPAPRDQQHIDEIVDRIDQAAGTCEGWRRYWATTVDPRDRP